MLDSWYTKLKLIGVFLESVYMPYLLEKKRALVCIGKQYNIT